LSVDPFFEDPPATAAEARRVRDAVFANPMMAGNIVSGDGKATMILAEGLPDTDKVTLYDALKVVASEASVDQETVTIAGRPVIEGEMGRIARSDITQMFPLMILTVAALLALTLRSLRGVTLPLLVVFTACTWTFGLMAWTGAPVHAISSMMPSLLIAIGVADGIHIVHYFLLRSGEHPEDDARSVTFATMREMIAPVVMTSVTTAAGFLSLAISSLESLQILGMFLAFGVMAAMIFSLTLLPALLCVLPLPSKAAARAARAHHADNQLTSTLMHAIARAIIHV
jgi:predicted RND superfamily exporter protein